MQRDARIPLWFLIANCVLILAALTLGIWIGQRRVHLLPEPQATALQLIHEAILSSHVDPHDPAELVDRAITGMVSGLDDYSQYVPPAKVQVFDEDMTGSYEGIGAVILATADAVVVRWPFPDGPAEQAGLQVGDRIVGIDGTSWATLAPEQRLDPSNKLLRGPKGSKVQLEVVRGEQAPFLVAVQRAPVQKASVKWIQLLDRDHGLGYLHIADFHSRTGHEVEQAILQLQQEAHDQLRGLVIDLRFDGGGILDQCVGTAQLFLQQGGIATVKRRGSEVVQSFTADAAKCRFPDLPLVLLVNGSTASASEVLAGALQDQHRAAVVGTRTYGKGMVNTVYSWTGLDFRLKLSTAYYYTPNGRNIERRHRNARDGKDEGGIVPDRGEALTEAQAYAVARRLNDNDVPAKYRAAVAALAQKLGEAMPQIVPPADDPQLAAALLELQQRAAAAPPATGHGGAADGAVK